jgi:DNA-binding beta-propeller fold protein YncE
MNQPAGPTIIATADSRLALRTIGRIPIVGPTSDPAVASRPLGVLCADGGRVFVTTLMWRTDPATKQQTELGTPSVVAVIDDAQQRVIAYVPVSALPRYAAFDPMSGRVFVTHNAEPKRDTLTVIDGAADTPRVISTLREGRNLLGVAVNPLTRRVYVAHSVDAKISVIDADSLVVLGQIKLENGIQLDRIAVDAATDTIYVPASRTSDKPATPWLYVIDGAAQTWTKVSLAGSDAERDAGAPRSIAFNPTTRQLYVARFGAVNSVAVLDHRDPAAPPRLVATVGGVGGNAPTVQVDPQRDLVFVANSTGPTLGKLGLGLSIIDGLTNAVFAPPAQAQQARASSGSWGLDSVPESGRLYVANGVDLSVSVVEADRVPTQTGAIIAEGEGRWSEPDLLAEGAFAAPVLLASGPGVLELFARAEGGGVWHQREEGGRWGEGVSLGGGLAYGPAALLSGPARLELFGVSGDGTLWTRARHAQQWSEWASFGGALAAAPAVLMSEPGRLELFAVGTDGALWTRVRQGEQWAEWTSLGGALVGAQAAALDTRGVLQLFALGADGALWQRARQGEQWAEWASLGGDLASPPAVASTDTGQLQVFALSGEGELLRRVWDGQSWGAWENLGAPEPTSLQVAPDVLGGRASGVLLAAPTTVATSDGTVHVFVAALGGGAGHLTTGQPGVTTWRHLGETSDLPAVPAGTLNTAGGLIAVVVGGLGLHGTQFAPDVLRLTMLRHSDLLNLEFDFINMQLQAGDPPQLVRKVQGKVAYIVAYFPPQHIQEEAFFEQDDSLQQLPREIGLPNAPTSIAELPEVEKWFAQLGFPLSAAAVVAPTWKVGGGIFTRWQVSDQVLQGTQPVTRPLYDLIGGFNNVPGIILRPLMPEPPKTDPLARARLANRSWLVFEIPLTVTAIPYTYEGILGACRSFPLSTAQANPTLPKMNDANYTIFEPKPGAWHQPMWFVLPTGDKTSTGSFPRPPHSAIELPYRLILSPSAGQWHHATQPVVDAQQTTAWTELWHTRFEPFEKLADAARESSDAPLLSTEQAGEVLGLARRTSVRAIWSPDLPSEALDLTDDAKLQAHKNLLHYQDPSQQPTEQDLKVHYRARTFRASLDAKDRSELVLLTAKRGLPGRRDIDVGRIMLSALGGWLDVRGEWDAPGLDIKEWRHRATLGRDHYARVVYDGYLMPFGHKAALVKISERKFLPSVEDPDGPRIAYLSQRMFIVVREPVREFTQAQLFNLSGSQSDLSWAMPFAKVTLTTLTTPKLNPPEENDVASLAQEAFWPCITSDGASRPFMFELRAHDREDHELHFTMPLLFVAQSRAEHDSETYKVKNGYNGDHGTLTDPLRAVKMNGQSFAFAKADRPGDTTFEAKTLRFEVVNIPSAPWFYPILANASIKVPALKQLMGNVTAIAGRLDGDSEITVAYSTPYADGEFAASVNPEAKLFDLVDEAGDLTVLDLDFLADGAPRLGLVNPSMVVSAISRSRGPIGDLIRAPANAGDAASLSMMGANPLTEGIKGAMILGAVALTDIINAATGEKTPKITTVNEGSAIVTTLSWKPAVHASGAFTPTDKWGKPIGQGESVLTCLSIELENRAPLDTTAASTRTTATLKDFALNLLDLVTVKFKTLEFVSYNGSKPDVNAELMEPPLAFGGALGLLQALAEKIPANGFQDPPFLDITSGGIEVGYTLDIPSLAFGAFALQNIALLAAIKLPFNGDPASLRFQFARRDQPFLVSISIFTGGGFFGFEIDLHGLRMLEASLEFGGMLTIRLGVANGAVALMGGIYFKLLDVPKDNGTTTTAQQLDFRAYLRMSGGVEVLGLISVSVDFTMELDYDVDTGVLSGAATVRVKVDVGFFSKSVSFTVTKEFATVHIVGGAPDSPALLGGSPAQETPTFADLIMAEHWAAYCAMFDDAFVG